MPKGQKPKPSAIKIAEGNRHQHARDKIKIDPVAKGRPRMPARLNPMARRIWADVEASLPDGVLTRADEGVLERYCVAYARFIDANTKVEATSMLIQTENGPARNPLLVVINNERREMNTAGSELGLSPASRARLAAPAYDPDDDPMSMLLGGFDDPATPWATTPKTKQ